MGGIYLAFVAIGAAAVLFGGDKYRQTGWLALTLFGAWGLFWFAGEFLAAPPARTHTGSVRLPDGTKSRGLVIPGRIGKARASVGAVVACMVVSALMAIGAFGPPGPRLPPAPFWALTAILCLIGLINLKGMRNDQQFFALTPQGFFATGVAGTKFVPWSSISSVEQTDKYGQPTLSIERSITGDEAFLLVGYALAPEAITSLVQRYVEYPSDRPSLSDVPTAPSVSGVLSDSSESAAPRASPRR